MWLRNQIKQLKLTQENRGSAVALTQFTRRVNCLLMRFPMYYGDYLKQRLQLPPCAWLVAPVSRTRQIQVAPHASRRGALPGYQEQGYGHEL